MWTRLTSQSAYARQGEVNNTIFNATNSVQAATVNTLLTIAVAFEVKNKKSIRLLIQSAIQYTLNRSLGTGLYANSMQMKRVTNANAL